MNSVLRKPGIHPLSVVQCFRRQVNAGLSGVIFDVLPEIEQLFEGADDVVVTVGLPELAGSGEVLVAFPGGGSLDALHDHFQFVARAGNDQQVDVIGHDDEIAQVEAVAVVFQELLADGRQTALVFQMAITVTLVECRMEETVEVLVELLLISFGQRLQLRLSVAAGHVYAPSVQPVFLLVLPLVKDLPGHGITEPEGDEVGRPLLTPVRQIAAIDAHGQVFVERHKTRTDGGRSRRTEFIPFGFRDLDHDVDCLN